MSDSDSSNPPATTTSISFSHVNDELVERARRAAKQGGSLLGTSTSLSKVVVTALAEFLPTLETRYNGGVPFAAPEHMPRGRKRTAAPQGADEPAATTKITVSGMRTDLLGRARGAIALANEQGPLLGSIRTLSQLLDEALAALLPTLETTYHHSAPRTKTETTTKVTFQHVKAELAGRAHGAIWMSNLHGPLLGYIGTLSDLINTALENFLPRLENLYNDGQLFPDPGVLPRGPKRGARVDDIDSSDTVKLTPSAVRTDLLGRARGAIALANEQGPLLGSIRTLSQLLDEALAALLPTLETTYHHSKPFPAPHHLTRDAKPTS